MKRKPASLTLQLFLSMLALNILTMCVVAVLGLRSANTKISEEYDAQLLTEASALWQLIKDDVEKGEVEELNIGSDTPLLDKRQIETLLKYAEWRAFRTWKGDQIIVRSDSADNMPPHPAPPGFSNILVEGETWRVFTLYIPESGAVVETFENLHDRELLQRDILFGVVGPLLIMLPLMGLLFSFGIGFALRGLRTLARRLSTRSPSDLSRLMSSDLPLELKPLADSVNSLLGMIEASITHEREFIDHAAHELRTPLSALKLQAQLLARSLSDPSQRMALDELLASVDRTARLVDQLLLLSRVAQEDIALEPVNMHDVIKETIGMYAVRVVDKHISLTLGGDERLTISAQPELLRTLIGTVLDNAVKYTPREGSITITVNRADAKTRVTITDTGEGIPETERRRVFDRFYRMPHTRQAGSGLGLAIASQIAELLHAVITLETPESGRGLQVNIVFA